MDLSRNALHKVEEQAEEDFGSEKGMMAESARMQASARRAKRKWTKEKPEKEDLKPKKKRKKFRYENKAERKLTRVKEKSKNSRQAKARRSG